ncbi:MAG: DNA polymerase II [Acidobacteria bacterium]|jgi:DNA polymerase-2|nr:DNA polymerase II [Acidobacteriota bacterium]
MPGTPPLRGFVLQPTYRVESGRPVVHLYGRLEDGRTFLVRDGRLVPHFYVEARDAAHARERGARRQVETDRVTLVGQPAVRVEVPTPSDTPPLRERLGRAGIATYEADVRFAMRYLIDHGVRGSVEIRGQGHARSGVGVVFDDPEIGPADWTPRLGVLSFDIETDPQVRRLLSIAIHGCGVTEVLLLTPPGTSCPDGARPFPTEKELLAGFCERVREIDPDVITGWNVIEFDLAVLQRLGGPLGVPLEMGRGPGALRLRSTGSARGLREALVPGRVVLDGIPLLRGAFVRMEDWSLDAVAREILGEGKTLTGRGRGEEILRLFHEDRERLVEYNRTDARLALEILERLHLVELAVERSRLTGLPLDRVSSSIAAFDFLYLSELGRRGIVAPSVGALDTEPEPQGGGHVLEPLPGLYSNVIVLDFKSLYPSLIRTFQIDPLNLIRPGTGEARDEADPIVAPSGAAFARRRGILTEMLDEIMPRREAARRAGDKVTAHAIKILMNSFYGVLGTPACRFYDPRLANAITSFGREVLLWCKERAEVEGRRVLYGDTDSLFVESGAGAAEAARQLGETLADELTRDLTAHISRRWRVTSRLELEFDRLYRRLCLPAVRRGTAGARKRYAGLVEDGRVVFTGMEAVRGDWTDLAREVQRELYGRLFRGQPMEEYLRQVVADLRAGLHDDRLVYRKSLRKPPEEYTTTTPPHVAAARKIPGKRRGRVAYVITTAGPEPAEDRRSPIDYEHYLDKQVRAVAEPVLALLGLEFGKVAGTDRQLSLF